MSDELAVKIMKFLIGKRINKIDFSRGLGIIPSKFIVSLSDEDFHYELEIESNFRVIYNGVMLCCFEDIYSTIDGEIISKKVFNQQNDFELTYLFDSLRKANDIIANKRITSCKLFKFGDCLIGINRNIKLHIINDNHYNDSLIYRILDCNTKKIVQCKNKKEYLINSPLFEVFYRNKKIEIINK